MKRLCMGLALLVFGWLPSASAQPGSSSTIQTTKGFVSINGLYQANSNDFQNSAVFAQNAEDGQLTTSYEVKAAPTFDVAGGATIWRQLGVGVSVSQYSRSNNTGIAASIPHPFFFNSARSVDGAANLTRKELAVHVQVLGLFPVSPRLLVTIFGGPSFFQVTQGVVTDVTYSETYPYDTASFAEALTTDAKESALGFNAGGDVAFFFSRAIGVGFTAKYSQATVDLPVALGGTTEAKAGGVQVGGGLRVRF